jgi:short-subunit dehydrogenase
LFQKLDVTDLEATGAVLAVFARHAGGNIDILFNNAGIDSKGDFDKTSWHEIMNIINVNLITGANLKHRVIPILKVTAGSLCISTSSGSTTFGAPGMAAYSATKHAIKGLTEALSVELQPYGVRVVDLIPGIIDAGMLPEEIKTFVPKEGMWRMMHAESVADTVWQAYQGGKLHWYIPEELHNYDVEITASPEKMRNRELPERYIMAQLTPSSLSVDLAS